MAVGEIGFGIDVPCNSHDSLDPIQRANFATHSPQHVGGTQGRCLRGLFHPYLGWHLPDACKIRPVKRNLSRGIKDVPDDRQRIHQSALGRKPIKRVAQGFESGFTRCHTRNAPVFKEETKLPTT